MAQDSSEEKTEEATPRRLREAREKGQVPKSKDVSQVLILVGVFAAMAFSMGMMGRLFGEFSKACFDVIGGEPITGAIMWNLGREALIASAKGLAPVFIVATVIAFLSNMIQVGALFTADPLMPKPEKLNPIEGLKNMFKVVTLIELVKNILKIIIVLYIAYQTISKSIHDVLLASQVDILLAAKMTGGIITEFFLKVAVLFIILSVADYMVQRWNFMKDMRMSKDEVKREYKQDEGDPHVKGERKRLHREMVFSDVRSAVKKSDVVVTNPVHVAVALEYNRAEMGAPAISAKGQRMFAEMIIEVARQENIPVIRNIPLAWSLLQLEIGDEIPEELYETVAEVLTLVHEMKEEEKRARENPNTIFV